ncbi:unnamed protein product [Sympodiomycopsis kandeliae]
MSEPGSTLPPITTFIFKMRTTLFASVAVAALAAIVTALPAPVPAPCETHIDYGYKAAPINVLSNNGKNSGLISSGNDNGYHQGDGSVYQAGTNSTQGAKSTADNNQKSSGAVGGDAAPQTNNADGNDSQSQSQSQGQRQVIKSPTTTTVTLTHTVTSTKWLIPTPHGHSN